MKVSRVWKIMKKKRSVKEQSEPEGRAGMNGFPHTHLRHVVVAIMIWIDSSRPSLFITLNISYHSLLFIYRCHMAMPTFSSNYKSLLFFFFKCKDACIQEMKADYITLCTCTRVSQPTHHRSSLKAFINVTWSWGRGKEQRWRGTLWFWKAVGEDGRGDC